jgi:2-C-methyl-D-erythritol 2,4-cyclodiphosphate synthase
MIGFGYDSHRFTETGSLIIGGIKIDSDFGVIAHSDGDVLIHALIDALFGASGLGDIGEHYPDSEDKYHGVSSVVLLKDCLTKIQNKKFKILNIDATIILEKPKLSTYKNQIKNNLADLCGVSIEFVNIKAKTNEKMGFIGRSEGIVCLCACQLETFA